MTLFELTHHESGIVVYPDNSVLVCNWSDYYNDDCLPMLTSFGCLVPWRCEDGLLASARCEHVDDLRSTLPGSIWLTDEADDDGNPIVGSDMDVISDDNDDLPQLFLSRDLDPREFEASVYTLVDGAKIITPRTWN